MSPDENSLPSSSLPLGRPGADCEISLTRLRYSKVVADCLRYVIVDRSADGVLQFSSQEPGDVRWFRFEPSDVERAAALALWRTSGENTPGWPLLLP